MEVTVEMEDLVVVVAVTEVMEELEYLVTPWMILIWI